MESNCKQHKEKDFEFSGKLKKKKNLSRKQGKQTKEAWQSSEEKVRIVEKTEMKGNYSERRAWVEGSSKTPSSGVHSRAHFNTS